MSSESMILLVSSLMLIVSVMVARKIGGLVSASGHALVLVWLAQQENMQLLLPAIGVAILAGLVQIGRKVHEMLTQEPDADPSESGGK